MTAVRFIKLEQRNKARHLCELAREHFEQGRRVLVMVADDDQAEALDRLLWTWNKLAFLPHSRVAQGSDAVEPILITTRETNPNQASVLLMGTAASEGFIEQFELVVDFAETYQADLAEQARERFRSYRQRGWDPQMYS